MALPRDLGQRLRGAPIAFVSAALGAALVVVSVSTQRPPHGPHHPAMVTGETLAAHKQ